MKPILFNTDMVKAILDGRKSVTRRVIKPQPTNPRFNIIGWRGWDDGHGYKIRQPYQPGDILYVRETWFYESHLEDRTVGEPDLPSGRYFHRYIYKADYPDYPVNIGVSATGWRPSIHMPKEAARIFLRVTDVRVERLRDISRDDTVAEGTPCWLRLHSGYCANGGLCDCEDYKKEFAALWDDTIKRPDLPRYGWEANPWVWVIEFERISKEEALAYDV